MDEIDKRILNEIQTDFPITSHPFADLGQRLHLSEQDILERIKKLKDEGIIRRIGGNFQSNRLNFTSPVFSTISATKQTLSRIKEACKKVR